ncbi:site-2 protease family protein [Thermoleophilum album]|uniref:site-2 protease family protein n=1 Tax=Thermoleophilum album TaxID=29539 RepID=UPI00237CED6C|nr:site-2 protease family protein [Thermoleophilum album]WDT94055.1 site-2 protease family protein [Thermoleophilum album]
MTSSIRLGRIAGIEVGVNWSWLIAAVLFTWVLADGVFPQTNPGLDDGVYLAMALVAVVVFFASLVAHEFGHALQARREGVAIDGITLWVFGGVAKLAGPFPTPEAELRIALAGPAVSLVLGLIFLAVAALLPLPAAADGVVHWLGNTNLVLLAFNMLPALPLDGGRVLRALLWRSRRDFRAATRTAAALGRGFGQGLIALGVLAVVAGGGASGVWLAFIGWFLLGAADAEARAAELGGLVSGLRVADAMVRDPVVVAPDLSLEDFLERVFFAHRHTAYPVVDDAGRAQGIVSFRDALRLPRDRWQELRVADVMVPIERSDIFAPDLALEEAMRRLAGSQLRRALVVRGPELIGLLSVTDVVRLLELFEAEAGAGSRYS